MVIRDTARPNLPIVADADQLAVERQKTVVAAAHADFVVAAGREASPRRMRAATLGCEPHAARCRGDEAGLVEAADSRGGGVDGGGVGDTA